MSALAGLDGACKHDTWLPVKVIMDNRGAGIDGRLEAAAGPFEAAGTVFSQQLSLPAASHNELFLYIKPQGVISLISLRMVSGDTMVAEKTLPLTCADPEDPIFGLVTTSLAPFSPLADLDFSGGKAQIASLTLQDLPPNAAGLAPLDLLVLAGVDTRDLSAAQVQAISAWLASGKQLVVAGGPDWQNATPELQALLPLHVEGVTTTAGLSGAAAFAGLPDNLSGETILAHGALVEGAQVLAWQDSIPLLVSKDYGAGRVIYLAFDPSQPSFMNWEGRQAFFRQLLVTSAPLPLLAGFLDWDQARLAASTSVRFTMPPAALIIAFLGLYVLVVGPLNFALLRILRRKEFAWATIPGLVLLFSGLAFLIGWQSLGSRPLLNRLAVLQVYPGLPFARLDGLVSVFSPRRAQYRLQSGPGTLWYPLPVSGVPPTTGQARLVQKEGSGWTDVRVDVGGMLPLAFAGLAPAPAISGEFNMQLQPARTTLTGSLRNDSDLNLENVVISFQGSAVPVGNMRAHTQVQVSQAWGFPGTALAPFALASPVRNPPAEPIEFNRQALSFLMAGTPDSQDARATMRSALLKSLGSFLSTSGQVLLAGWADRSPMDAGLQGVGYEREDTTLVLVLIKPAITAFGDKVILPPSLFTWHPLQPANARESPYSLYIDRGEYAYEYTLTQPLAYSKVLGLVLHIRNFSSTGPIPLDVSLWDFRESQWQVIPGVTWMNYRVPQPERYASASGEVRMRLANRLQSGFGVLQGMDVSLEIQP